MNGGLAAAAALSVLAVAGAREFIRWRGRRWRGRGPRGDR
jgi:hypothetical protein